jgi:hypothetical protein
MNLQCMFDISGGKVCVQTWTPQKVLRETPIILLHITAFQSRVNIFHHDFIERTTVDMNGIVRSSLDF